MTVQKKKKTKGCKSAIMSEKRVWSVDFYFHMQIKYPQSLGGWNLYTEHWKKPYQLTKWSKQIILMYHKDAFCHMTNSTLIEPAIHLFWHLAKRPHHTAIDPIY